MKTTLKIFLILAIGIVLVIISLIWLYESGKICRSDPLAYYDSPNLQNHVLHGAGFCNESDVNTSLFTNWINLNSEEILRFDSKLQGIDIKWISNNELQITLPKEAVIQSQKLDVNKNVKVILNKD
ncbi:MAG: hypothetical protein WCP15_04110 [bacterium]